jgi:hypothetical protein
MRREISIKKGETHQKTSALTKKKSFADKHKFEITFGLLTLLAGSLILYYQSEHAGQKVESGIEALGHQATALRNGLTSNVVKTPSGFNNADGATANATIRMSGTVSILVNCGHGIVINSTGPINCPVLVANLTGAQSSR